MQGFDHRLVAIHQAELRAEARRERIAGVASLRVPVQPVQPVRPGTTSIHHGWRGVIAHLASSRPVAHGHHS